MIVHLIDGTYELFRYFLSPAAAYDRSAPEALGLGRPVRGHGPRPLLGLPGAGDLPHLLGFNLVGDSLRDLLDPKSRG